MKRKKWSAIDLKAFFCKELLVTKKKNHEQSPFSIESIHRKCEGRWQLQNFEKSNKAIYDACKNTNDSIVWYCLQASRVGISSSRCNYRCWESFLKWTTSKGKLRNKMGQKLLNGCLVTFSKREFFLRAKDKDIVIAPFKNMKDKKTCLVI